jgi:cobaltochelatase CobS
MSEKIEDLVKNALKEALASRKKVAATPPFHVPSESATTEEVALKTESTSPIVPVEIVGKTLLAGQWRLSEVIGTRIEDTNNFGVTVFDDKVWHDSIKNFIPTVDSEYIIDTDIASDILRAWELDEKVLCFGPTGAGKSSLVEQLCARTRRPFIRINCTGDMDSSMIFGQLTAEGGSTIWVDGAVTEAVRYGAVFAWDEWDVTPPEISMGLQWLLEDGGKLFLKEKPGTTNEKLIIPHKDFRLVAIGNTRGQGDDTGAHAGTNVQNSATLDRFGTAVYIGYLQPAQEEKMLVNKWKNYISVPAARDLVKLANLVRKGYTAGQFNLTISPRTLLNICRKMSCGATLQKAYTVVYLNKLSDVQRKVADELFTRVYGAPK